MPIYPHLDADPAEVVADYLLDNGVVVREKGEWRKAKDGYTRCSVCNSRGSAVKAHYCHHCGADMRKGENDGV